MKIKILQLIEGAKKAEGLTVIIDVFRAFSTACYLFNNGVNKVIPVGELDTARGLKEKDNTLILMGERSGKTVPGFDYGNSPALIKDIDFSGENVVHTTSAGTQGIVHAENASEIITGSFVNASAVVKYILKKKPSVLTLVCMGNAGVEKADEDILCALYIKYLIINQSSINLFNKADMDLLKDIINQGTSTDMKNSLLKSLIEGDVCSVLKRDVIERMLRQNAGQRFFNPANKKWSPPDDFYMCLQFSIFDFVLRVKEYTDGTVYLQKVEI